MRRLIERWLLSERPGLRQLLLAIVALVLPLLTLGADEGADARALSLSVGVGCGLGIAWLIACGRRWFAAAPMSAALVLATCFASAGNLELIPRWDALVRAQRAREALAFYAHARVAGERPTPPAYATGRGRVLAAIDETADGALRCVYTGEPIERWSVIGWRASCHVLVRADGTAQLCRNAEALAAARQAARR